MSAVINSRTIEKKIQRIQKLIEEVTEDVIVFDKESVWLFIDGQYVDARVTEAGMRVSIMLGRKEK